MRGLLALAFALCVCSSFALIRHDHVGALNKGFNDVDARTGLFKSRAGDASEQWFTQRVDHFDLTDAMGTFQQLYFSNDTYYKPGGPLFVVIGGEGPLTPAYVSNRFIVDAWAKKFNAKVVALEHRFYGKSYPWGEQSTPVSALKYLTSEQALADLATFAAFQQKSCNGTCKTIIFGGSYAGNLAAWARTKYPTVFSGALASSGPVLAQEDFPEYFEVVTRAVGASCAARLEQATNTISGLLKTAAGRAQLESTFGTCAPITSEKDQQMFLESITDPVCGIVQYHKDNRGSPATNIEDMCAVLNAGSDPVKAWADFLKKEMKGTCVESSYENFLKSLRGNSAGRSWTFQTCTEFGYFQTGVSSYQPFSSQITLQFFRDICIDLFGTALEIPKIDVTNLHYGGLALKSAASNIYFTDGTVDPWHALAILPPQGTAIEQLQLNSGAALIEGTAHCADLYAAGPNDLPSLTQARAFGLQLLTQWLK